MENLIDDCLFCKIIRKEVPSYTVFENDDVVAFLDISQANPGHTLLVPKKHLENLFDYSNEDAKRYLQYIPQVAKAIRVAFPEDTAMNILVNNGKAASQMVMHSHIHFVPRFEGDGLQIIARNNAAEYDEAKYQAVADKIKAQF
ncbi:HIT family protein [Lactobacillus gigeriorum]|uniref:HIT family protein n=1 Tax=Lactobacillus gigeriorum DSM 23908 = CRBIP 24.85 TaxID=1423751 RepID=I7KP32_9LACO|nr:HIT family protein [Lactobacillus gigeriorum]KRN12821.1 HIT family protein [Lactobacillus gigeriorum DSM 23908 = CRBIP 24.85]CCI87089.1 HIT family protein [Lactobacillus gigeriorum DSM 23908 = CRBIP 24.85]